MYVPLRAEQSRVFLLSHWLVERLRVTAVYCKKLFLRVERCIDLYGYALKSLGVVLLLLII